MSTKEEPLKVLTVTICGGGNGAHTAAAYLGSKPALRVNVLTRKPELWSKNLVLSTKGSSWEHKGEFKASLNKVTADPSEVIPTSDVIFVAAPANAHPPILRGIAPHVRPGCLVGALYGQGGFDWAAREALGEEKLKSLDALFGLLNIPWICRADEYGKRARVIGPKQKIFVTTTPVDRAVSVARTMGMLFDIPCGTVPNFLSVTLTPSNQIIHPARYYGIFKGWDGKRVYQKEEISWGLYSEMDDLSADWLQKLDDELQAVKQGLCKRYPDLDLSYVEPLGPRIVRQYGPDVSDRSSLKQIFRTNKGYLDCKTPAKAVEGGFIPAVDSRLFWEDIPYGLVILKDMAEMMNLPTPAIDFMIEWHQQFMNKQYLVNGKLNRALIKETAAPSAYGITSLDQLVANSLPPKHTHTHTSTPAGGPSRCPLTGGATCQCPKTSAAVAARCPFKAGVQGGQGGCPMGQGAVTTVMTTTRTYVGPNAVSQCPVMHDRCCVHARM